MKFKFQDLILPLQSKILISVFLLSFIEYLNIYFLFLRTAAFSDIKTMNLFLYVYLKCLIYAENVHDVTETPQQSCYSYANAVEYMKKSSKED